MQFPHLLEVGIRLRQNHIGDIHLRNGQAILFETGGDILSQDLAQLFQVGIDLQNVDVFFLDTTGQVGIKWGTDSKVRLFDPASGLHIEIGACGNFSLRVCNARKLLVKLVGTASEFKQSEIMGDNSPYSISSVVGKFKSLVMSKVKANLARVIKENNINILEIDGYIDLISEKLGAAINEILEEYGLVMPEFYVTSIMTPDDDPNYRRLKQQFADKTLRVREEEIRKAEAEAAQSRRILEAQTEAQLKMVGAQGDAEAIRIKAQADADAYKAQAFAEAEEMRAKGYTYQQETARMVGVEAMKNGITGGGSTGGSALGDVAALGVTLGAMGGVIGMTKEAMNPIMSSSSEIGGSVVSTTIGAWDCACGQKGISSNFCPNCGSKKPEADTWDCACGQKGVASKFCPNCGSKKPENSTWDCPQCGSKGISGNFCPECGCKKEV